MASSNFINECKNSAYCNRYGKLEFDGLEINENNQLVNFTIESGCYDNGDIIGNTYVKKIEGNLLDSINDDLADKNFDVSVGAKYLLNNTETTEYVELGTYEVERPTDTQTENRTSFVGYDMLLTNLDKAYSTELDYENETITIADIYEELCDTLGLTPVTTTFTNSTLTVEGNPFTNGEKNRDVLKSIEKASCSFVDIDPDTNKIDLCWLSNDLDYTFELSDYSTLEGGKIVYGPINSLVIKSSVAESENVSIEDSESIAEYGEHQFIISEDYFLYDATKRQAVINDIWAKVHNLTYVDCKLTSYTGKPFLRTGNKIRVYTSENDYFDTYVLKHKFTFDGAFMSEIESPVLTQQEVQTKQDISLGDKLRTTQIIVNKQEGTIEGLVSKTNTIDTTVNNNYQEIVNRFDGYTPVSRTVEIENSVSTLQTDTYTKTQIDTKLVDGSVEKVMTASGTYDINGMTYEKSNANTKTIINEVGVGVKKTDGSDDYILFAGYVNSGNTQFGDFEGQTVVASENMVVKNYFVIGQNSRMEDYENGSGVFYIGG